MESAIEGKNPVLEALRSGRPINRIMLLKVIDRRVWGEILAIAKKKRIPIEWVEKRILDKKSQTDGHQGVIAYGAAKEYCEIEDLLKLSEERGEPALIMLLDGIEDPHNLGAVIRNVEASGAHGVVIPKRRAAPLTETVSKTSAGAVETVLVARVSNMAEAIEKLKEAGVWVVGIESDGEKAIYDVDLKLPTAFVIGSEGEGISRLVKERCEVTASIPMKGKISSLNASAAAAVVLFEALRHRR